MTKFLTPLLTLALLTLGACGNGDAADDNTGGKKGDKGGDQKASQPADPKAKFAGTWMLENEKMVDLNSALFEEAPMMKPMFEQMFANTEMSFTLNADGTVMSMSKGPDPLSGEMKEETGSGDWKLESEIASITIADEGGEPKTATGKLDGDRLVLEMKADMPKPLTMSFKRK